jgi:predicted outer membrane repeat protein
MGVVLLLLPHLGCGLTTEDTGTVSDAGSATGGEGGTDEGVQGGAEPMGGDSGGDAGNSNGAAGDSGAEGGTAGARGELPDATVWCQSPDVRAYLPYRRAPDTVAYGSIRGAMAEAAPLETVAVCPGRHELGDTLYVFRTVMLVAAVEGTETVLDLGGSGDVVRVETQVRIEGLTLTGSTDGRGLVAANQAVVMVRDSVIADNGGGGVAVEDGATVELDNTRVSNNTAADGGGGVRADNATVLLVNGSVVSENSATESGGGVSCFGYGSLTIEASRVSGNVSHRSGGGIVNNCALSIRLGSEISGNTAHSNGGGLADSGIDGGITDTAITGNHADNDGGGISCLESDGLHLTEATVSGNTAGQRGGGAYISGGTLRSTDTDWGTPEVDDNSPADVSFLDSDYDYAGVTSFECEEPSGCTPL